MITNAPCPEEIWLNRNGYLGYQEDVVMWRIPHLHNFSIRRVMINRNANTAIVQIYMEAKEMLFGICNKS